MALTQLPGTQVKDSTIKNIDIASDAAIDISKLALPTTLPDKATPADADVLTGSDSAASNVWKKFTWANIKATLKTYFDTLYFALSGGSLSGALNEAKGTDIASAATTNIGAATGNYVVVTGTTTITGLGTVQAGTRRIVNFNGALILTHHATALILPTGANITTDAGDTAIFISLGSGNWVCTNYQRKNGTALAAAGGSSLYTESTSDYTTYSTSLMDVTNMSLNVVANKSYIIIATIYVDANTNAGNFKFTYPSGATSSFLVSYFRQNYAPYLQASTTGYLPSPSGNQTSFLIVGRLVVSSTAGTFKLQINTDNEIYYVQVRARSNISLIPL